MQKFRIGVWCSNYSCFFQIMQKTVFENDAKNLKKNLIQLYAKCFVIFKKYTKKPKKIMFRIENVCKWVLEF